MQTTFLTFFFLPKFSLYSKEKGGEKTKEAGPPFLGTAPNLGGGLGAVVSITA